MFKQFEDTTRTVFFAGDIMTQQNFTEADFASMKDGATEIYKTFEVVRILQMPPEVSQPLTQILTEVSEFYIRAVFDRICKGKLTSRR
jgi:hypothetical protein